MTGATSVDAESPDGRIDDEIYACLDLIKPISFFLYAGAGSGKTRSVVNVVNRLRRESGRRLLLRGQHIGVITYTNAACDEIKRRLEFDPLVEVSTIHSFAWALVSGFQPDIRAWLRTSLVDRIAELEGERARGRAGTKAALARDRAIAHKRRRLERLPKIRRFVYSPKGDNQGRDALNHSEVIGIASTFLSDRPTLQRVLVNKFPILLVDESQDTNSRLMEALLAVQKAHGSTFCLGLFGDTMQRIYSDGMASLAEAVPNDWRRPAKQMNYRCPGRIIRLINRIRSAVDGHVQTGKKNKAEGTVRLFILSAERADKFATEAEIASKMGAITEDQGWASTPREFKTLILEHHMAAKRMGFDAMFRPLHAVQRFETGLLEGTLPAIRFFSRDVLPFVRASQRGDHFAIAAIVRSRSPILEAAALKATGGDQREQVKTAKLAAESLAALWKNGGEPTFFDVLRNVWASRLFVVPEQLRAIAESQTSDTDDEEDAESDSEFKAWTEMLATPFGQMFAYDDYISGRAPFGTHQGVKGLEFPRVMVIIDDKDARGFMFSYERLFGAKEKTEGERKKEGDGGETTMDRTRRLFYVTCSRAVDSLAIVAYSENPKKVASHVLAEGWFDKNEVEVLD